MIEKKLILLLIFSFLVLSACQESMDGEVRGTEIAAFSTSDCDSDNGGLELPTGFCATVVADSLGRARHIVVRDNGDIYVALREVANGGGIAALRDTTGDGRADIIERFGDFGGTGIDLRNGYLYFAPDTAVIRYRLAEGELVPQGEYEVVAGGFPEQRQHAAKPFAFDEAGNLYVNSGAPSNACQAEDRSAGSPGQDPCPLLERHGGIWRFSADQIGQTQMEDGVRYATGIRNAVAIDWNPATDHLYVLQHGRDQLNQNWPDMYTVEQSAELPAEEFFLVEEGSDFGWPFCYYDQVQGKKVLAPEYGGTGTETGRCEQVEDPILAFPGHIAPNDLVFYNEDHFPEPYQGGAFIAFHGSWNRAPLEQEGYNVVYVPFEGDLPAGDWEVFADGFAGDGPIQSPGDARFRPMGLAIGPEGTLYITDSVTGRVWRVVYTGTELPS